MVMEENELLSDLPHSSCCLYQPLTSFNNVDIIHIPPVAGGGNSSLAQPC